MVTKSLATQYYYKRPWRAKGYRGTSYLDLGQYWKGLQSLDSDGWSKTNTILDFGHSGVLLGVS